MKRQHPSGLFACLVSLLVAACGSPGTSAERHEGVGQAVWLRPTPLADQGTQLAPATEETRRLVGRRTSLPWQIVRVDGAELRLVADSADCAPFGAFAVAENGQTVTIAALAAPDPWSSTREICQMKLIKTQRTVRLRSPLATRRLMHAPVTADWDAAPARRAY